MATGTTPMPSADTQQQVTDQPQNTSDGFGVEPAESVPTEASDSLDEFTASINADISNQAAAIKAVDASVDASATSNSNPTLYDPSNI